MCPYFHCQQHFILAAENKFYYCNTTVALPNSARSRAEQAVQAKVELDTSPAQRDSHCDCNCMLDIQPFLYTFAAHQHVQEETAVGGMWMRTASKLHALGLTTAHAPEYLTHS